MISTTGTDKPGCTWSPEKEDCWFKKRHRNAVMSGEGYRPGGGGGQPQRGSEVFCGLGVVGNSELWLEGNEKTGEEESP